MALALGAALGKLGGGGAPPGMIEYTEGPLETTASATVGNNRTTVINLSKTGEWIFVLYGTINSSTNSSTQTMWVNGALTSVGGATDEDPIGVIVEGSRLKVDVTSNSKSRTSDVQLKVRMVRKRG